MRNTLEGSTELEIVRFGEGRYHRVVDSLAVEEPLEIRLEHGPAGERTIQNISITMRTPGHDPDLASGFLYSEGLIDQYAQIRNMEYAETWFGEKSENTIRVALSEDREVDLERLKRHFYTTSSCGVCGKASISALDQLPLPLLPVGSPRISAEVLGRLPQQISESQPLFRQTGGIHAAGLFDTGGKLCLSREDVGRHNALDKLIGAALKEGLLPSKKQLLLVSGRTSFELVQKAVRAGIPILAAVGAPSSLAVQLAQRHGMTLVGFLRPGQFNVYAGIERIYSSEAANPV